MISNPKNRNQIECYGELIVVWIMFYQATLRDRKARVVDASIRRGARLKLGVSLAVRTKIIRSLHLPSGAGRWPIQPGSTPGLVCGMESASASQIAGVPSILLNFASLL